jgi:drug/metabolite transporter (DMT)-like permease
VALTVYILLIKETIKVSAKQLFLLLGIGGVIAFHWFAFYHAIKVSNVSVTLAAFATGTLFTSIIEPIFYKRKVLWYEIVFGLIIIASISIIFKVETRYSWGIIFGMLAALTSSLFTVWNGMLVRQLPSVSITFYELLGGFLFLSLYILFFEGFKEGYFQLSMNDWICLSILAVVGTAFPFIASVNLLKKISPFTITLTVNLETVYGIILAYFIWRKDEQMTITFYIGTLLILGTIVANAIFKARAGNR